jgi:hypothetical protein
MEQEGQGHELGPIGAIAAHHQPTVSASGGRPHGAIGATDASNGRGLAIISAFAEGLACWASSAILALFI